MGKVSKSETGKVIAAIGSFLIKIKDHLSAIQSICLIAGIIAGLIWFYDQGESRPRVIISHKITSRKINDDAFWINVSVKIHNIGKVPVHINSGFVRIQKIIPLSDEMTKDIKRNVSIIDKKSCIVRWPPACQHYEYKLKDNLSIEPGEFDRKSYEFFVPSDLKTIKVYSYFENPEKSWWKFWEKPKPIGWNEETIYDLK
jgi:hypothetical protein